jgi:hypothetical protein
VPAGKATVSGGVAWGKRLHFGLNMRSMRRYAKPTVAALSLAELTKYRRDLRWAFRIYAIDCVNLAPTGTVRRKGLRKIGAAAARLVLTPNHATADELLTALDTPDLDARRLAYTAMTTKGHEPVQVKRRLRHWTIASSVDDVAIAAARELANLDVEALAPVGGRFPDPGLAHLVASLIPIWEKVTRRTAGLVSIDKEGEKKKCPFGDWLDEMHALLDVPRPPVGRIVDIVRLAERSKNPAPVTGS